MLAKRNKTVMIIDFIFFRFNMYKIRKLLQIEIVALLDKSAINRPLVYIITGGFNIHILTFNCSS